MTKIYSLFSNYTKSTVYVPLVVYWIILFILTSIPSKSLPKVALSDKFNHFAAYTILAFLIYMAIYFSKRFKITPKLIFFFTLGIALIYGGLDEIHQMYVPGRYAEWFDWLADIIGSGLGAFLAYLIVTKGGNKGSSTNL